MPAVKACLQSAFSAGRASFTGCNLRGPEKKVAAAHLGFNSRLTLEKGLLERRADLHPGFYSDYKNGFEKWGMEIKEVITKICEQWPRGREELGGL